MNIAEQIKRGMALAFFATAFADQADECGDPLRGEIMDQLPDEIDPAAIHAADTLAHDMIWKCPENVGDLPSIYAHAQSLGNEGADRELSPELFGHYCAMQAMGTGVGLESFGREVRDSIRVPYLEFGSHSLEKDYFGRDPVRVVFRKWKNGSVIALFPDEAWTDTQCASYEHVGQHGGADYSHVVRATKPATAQESASLAAELESIGYKLRIVSRR